MKKIYSVLTLFVFIVLVFSCGSTKESVDIPDVTDAEKKAFSQTEGYTIQISSDETEYEIIIIEPGFNVWLQSIARPEGFYSQSFLESRNQILVVNPSRWAQCLVQLGYAEAVIDELQEYQDPGERRAQDREAIPNNRLFGLKGGLGIPQQDLGSK